MSDTITRVSVAGREFVLLGTAHVSQESVDEVEKILREERPERVCVEIDAARHQSLTEGSSWSTLRIDSILRQNKGFLLLGNLMLSSFQRRLGLDLGVRPGQEMLKAVEVAKELEIPYSLCDREIQVTLRRAWAKNGFWGKNKLLASLLTSVLSTEKLSAQEIEGLKKKNALEGMMEELAAFLPKVKEVLIDERDQYLAANLFRCGERRILAVVGAGHVPGIKARLEALGGLPEASLPAALDLSALEQIPPPSRLAKALPWLIPGAIVALILAGFLRSGWNEGWSMVGWWILANGGLSALGSLAALAHPVTVISAIVAAPIATLNPAIGVGMITGLIEAFFRKPQVADFENLHDDITTLRGFYRNRVTRILLVFLLSSLGGIIGNVVALPYLTAALG